MRPCYFEITLGYHNSTSPDDTITFRTTGQPDELSIRFRTERERHELNPLPASTAQWQFQHLLQGLAMDTEPQQEIQISMTGFPSILQSVSDLEVGNLLWSHLVGLFALWMGFAWRNLGPLPSGPSPQTRRAVPSPIDSGDLESDSESDADSFPPRSAFRRNYGWGGAVPPPAGANSGSH